MNILEDIYSFMEHYIEECFETEAVLKASPRGTVERLRQKDSHKRYICRKYSERAEVYLSLLGKSCPYLPRIYEAALDQDQNHMLVLEEYVAGDTLAMLLQAGPLTGRQVRKICIQLCKGLYVLHSLGWVHRDIKPENIIILGDRAVLIDYDAARSYESGKNKDTHILGTVGYAPPEQYGISETDFRANVSSGGSAHAYEPDDDEIWLAKQAAHAVGADFAGVDLLFGEEGMLVCEVNSNAQFAALKRATGIDITDALFEYILRNIP